MTEPKFFNAHHSPVGAFATLTLGMKGANGGLGLELGGPANEPFFVGIESLEQPGTYQALPFFGEVVNAAANYDVEKETKTDSKEVLSHFSDSDIQREFKVATDTWKAGDLTFSIYSPPRSIHETEGLRETICPGIVIEVTVNNSKGNAPRKAFLGYAGSDRGTGMRIIHEENLLGIGQGNSVAIATKESDVYAGIAWQPEVILNPIHVENLPFMLGSLGLLVMTVGAGETRTFRFAAGFYRERTVTAGMKMSYCYRKFYDSLEQVLNSTLEYADNSIKLSREADTRFSEGKTEDRAFMLAHATRSYYGSTQLLQEQDGTPFWIVNEGEYRMMNTFDLTVDQVFYELEFSPWTVKNVLDSFVKHYSYEEELRFWGSDELQPGGLTFTHDMGVSNTFSASGYSSYEQVGLTGCFSYMSSEELMNWIICASLYVSKTGDEEWLKQNASIFKRCLASMMNRDHPDDAQRNGIMSLDGNRCKGGAEITTYDSLDESLGQARNNLYLGVKAWASYLLLEKMFGLLGDTNAVSDSTKQAKRAAATIAGAVEEGDLLPAVIGEGYNARIIPAIEALVYPWYAGIETNSYSELITVLRKHFEAIMKPGVCKFEDGGWKLSSTSNNSWLSKIYLCQFVAEKILGYDQDKAADKAHVGWLQDTENIYFAWSDQMLSGKAVGSKYYPRGVTSFLWLD
jgi:xylan 1,4-beta-xylosidase